MKAPAITLGYLVNLVRFGRRIPYQSVANFAGLTFEEYRQFEDNKFTVSEKTFARICKGIGANRTAILKQVNGEDQQIEAIFRGEPCLQGEDVYSDPRGFE